MSKDFIVFDPSGLEPLPGKERLLDWIHSIVGDGQACSVKMATEKIDELLQWASGKYGSKVDEHSTWSSWPPSLLASGRHCTFNLGLGVDAMSFTMQLFEQSKRLGLVMIDPSGNNPFVTIPGGGGLLD